MTSKLLFHEHTRTELKALAPDALVVFPVGAIEQHGPHLPVATDSFAVEHVTRAAAAQAAAQIPLVVAPTLYYGSSHHHLPFGATLSLSTETYYRVLTDLIESLVVGGFKRFFIVNGHGGNDELINLIARDIPLKHPVGVAAACYWNIAWEALVAAGAHNNAWLPGHAGVFETSLILALRPELVLEPRPHRDGDFTPNPRSSHTPYRSEPHNWWVNMDGYTDSPDLGEAERGRRALEIIIAEVAKALVEFYRKTE